MFKLSFYNFGHEEKGNDGYQEGNTQNVILSSTIFEFQELKKNYSNLIFKAENWKSCSMDINFSLLRFNVKKNSFKILSPLPVQEKLRKKCLINFFEFWVKNAKKMDQSFIYQVKDVKMGKNHNIRQVFISKMWNYEKQNYHFTT